jgi:hypothetical protein
MKGKSILPLFERWTEMGIIPPPPHLFVTVASKGLTGYAKWKSAQELENKGYILLRTEDRRRRQLPSDVQGGTYTPGHFVSILKQRACEIYNS